jgi:hypothetical protein
MEKVREELEMLCQDALLWLQVLQMFLPEVE